MERQAVFLDRDGTLNEHVRTPNGSLRSPARPEELVLLPGAVSALATLAETGLPIIVVTNQPGVAKGHFTEADLESVHSHLLRIVTAAGGRIDAIYYCPHHPLEGRPPFRRPCECRKPAPGLLHRAARDLQLDLGASYMVGDSEKDIRAGKAAGCRTVLLGRHEQQPETPDCSFADLPAFTRWFVQENGRG